MLSIKTQKQQTVINLISGILAMVVNLGVNFFLSPYLVETLGEEANGFTQLANNFVTYASLLTIAFNSMASRFMSINYHQGKHKKVKEYYSSIIVCNITICILLIPIALYIVGNLNDLIVIENADVTDVQTLFGCVFLNFFGNLFVSVAGLSMYVTNSIYYQNIINLVRYVLNGILLFCAFFFLPTRVYYVSFVACILTVITIPITKSLQKKLMPELKFSYKDFRKLAVKEMLFSGIWNTVNQCGNMLMTGLDLLLSNIFISPASMGILSVAKTIPSAIINLATTLNSNFSPSITISWAKGDKKQMLQELRGSMKISSVFVSLPIMTFCSFGVQFYSLWMPRLDAKMLTVLSFLTCMAFIPWAGPQALYNVFTAANKLRVNSLAFVCTGILNVIFVFICLKYTDLGVYAIAGISSSLTILRNLIITAPYTAKLLGLRWYEFYKDVAISLICCAINYCVARVVGLIIPVNSWLLLVIASIVSCLITLILELFVILSKKEREIIIKKIRRK